MTIVVCPICGEEREVVGVPGKHCLSCAGYVRKWGEVGFWGLQELARRGHIIEYIELVDFLGQHGQELTEYGLNSLRRAFRSLGHQAGFTRKNATAFNGKKCVRLRNEHCKQCGATDNLCVHHIVPLDWGGADDPGNIETLCRKCHLKEHKRINKAIRRVYGSPRTLRNRLLQEHAPYIAELIGRPLKQ